MYNIFVGNIFVICFFQIAFDSSGIRVRVLVVSVMIVMFVHFEHGCHHHNSYNLFQNH